MFQGRKSVFAGNKSAIFMARLYQANDFFLAFLYVASRDPGEQRDRRHVKHSRKVDLSGVRAADARTVKYL